MDAKSVAEVIEPLMEKYHGTVNEVLETHKTGIQSLADRLDDLETRAANPGRTGPLDSKAREHRTRFERWLRNPNDSEAKSALAEFETRALGTKDVTIGSNAGGGFAVPEELAREIGRLELEFSPVRRLVRVVRVGSNDNRTLVSARGTTSGWVGESGSRTATSTPQLRERSPAMGELYALPTASEWSLDDIFFNVANWLAEEVAQEFAQQEGQAVISGDGSDKPLGLLATTPVDTDDFASPERAAAAYKFVPSLTASSPAVAEILPDALINLVYDLNAAYRPGASWVMNSSTAGAIRKLKDDQGRFLWADSLEMGQPSRLLGYPVEIWEDMQSVGAANFPVAFGNFRRGYLLVDRTELRILRDPYSTPGFVRFYVRRREGGCVLDNHAIRWLRTTTS